MRLCAVNGRAADGSAAVFLTLHAIFFKNTVSGTVSCYSSGFFFVLCYNNYYDTFGFDKSDQRGGRTR